jgi:cytochrome P450
VEEVLVTRGRDFRKNLSPRLRSSLGNGLLVSEGDDWLRQRRRMQPAFHRQRIDGMAETMVSIVAATLDGWRAGEKRDMYREMLGVSLQIVARTLFGTDVTTDMPRIRQSSEVMTEHLRSRLFSLYMLLPDVVPTPGNRRHAAAVRDLDVLIYRLIAERRATPGTPPEDLLDMLLSARDAASRLLTDRQVRDEVLTIMSAGYDTTALAVTWAWVLLTRNPEVEQRMRAQIGAVVGERRPTAADVMRLTHVEDVVTETLRLYPPAWAITRQAVRHTSIGGQRISAGTTVLASAWVLHRDPRFFEAPELFRPERWAGDIAGRLPRFAYMPFGGGQRTCIGNGFALLEIALLLAAIAQRFRISLADPDQPPRPLPVLTLQPDRNVEVCLSSV